MWANWLGVGCLALDSINRQRAAILARRWWLLRLSIDSSEAGTSAAAAQAAGSARSRRGRERLGVRCCCGCAAASASALEGSSTSARPTAARRSCASSSGSIATRITDRDRAGRRGKPPGAAIALRPQATGATALKALLHASWLDEIKTGRHPIATPEEAVAASRRVGPLRRLRRGLAACLGEP